MNRLAKGILNVSGVTTAVMAGTFVSFENLVISEAKKQYWDDCEYLLILGGDIYGADTPSPQLLERMKTAAVYLNGHKNTIAIPCGGCFRELQKKSEAQVIADYLMANGVEADRIILEDKSTTTIENFLFAKKILEDRTGKSVKELNLGFLSSSYHIFRASLIGKDCGFGNTKKVTAPTPGEAAKRYAREYFAAYALWIKKLQEVLK